MAGDGELAQWDQRTASLLEDAYVDGGSGPQGSGAGSPSEGKWRAKRQHLVVPMDRDGDWLDVGCANGHLLATLPLWASEVGRVIEPFGLELLPKVADLARSLQPTLADRIWTGSAMGWEPPQMFDYVTALDDAVPPDRLKDLVDRLLSRYVVTGGRLIISSWTNRGVEPRDLFGDLAEAGYLPDGTITIDRPGAAPLLTAWIDAR